LSLCEQHEHAQFGCGDLAQMTNAESVVELHRTVILAQPATTAEARAQKRVTYLG
jgi:hypothetical protein